MQKICDPITQKTSDKKNRTQGGDPRLGCEFIIVAFRPATSIDDLNGGPIVIGQYEVMSAAAVPEPTSMAIFGLGALGMAYLARRKSMV